MAYLGTLRFNDNGEYELHNNVEIVNLTELFNTMLLDTVQVTIMNKELEILVNEIGKLELREFYKSSGKRKYKKKASDVSNLINWDSNTVTRVTSNKNKKLYTYRIGKIDFDNDVLQDYVDKEIMISIRELEKEDIEDIERLQENTEGEMVK